MIEILYFDYNATTPPTSEILDLADKLQREHWFNPNSAYKQARETRKIIDKAREQCANAIGAEPEQIIFTSCASESNAIIYNYAIQEYDDFGVYCTYYEHTDVTESPFLKCDTDIDKLTTTPIQFLSSMLVNNESGRVFDLVLYGNIIHQNRRFNNTTISSGKLHSDMSQAFGKIPIIVKNLNVDFATFSSQKIGSIRGCSTLYVKEPKAFKKEYQPMIFGHQEHGMRGGTENTVAIACMGEAMERYNYSDKVNNHYKHLKQIFVNELSKIDGAVVLNVDTDKHKFTNNVVQVSFKGVGSESLVLLCDTYGLCISGGAACNSGSLEPSNEVKYLCSLHDENEVNSLGVVRISYGRETTEREVYQAIEIIKKAVETLRQMK